MVFFIYKYTLGSNFNDPDFHSIHEDEESAKLMCSELARIHENELDFSIPIIMSSSPNTKFPRTEMNNKHHIVGNIIWECTSSQEFEKDTVLTYGFMCGDDFQNHKFVRVGLGLSMCPEEYYYADYTINKDIIDEANKKLGLYNIYQHSLWYILKPKANIYFGKITSINDIIYM
jgi:hypothetical protein